MASDNGFQWTALRMLGEDLVAEHAAHRLAQKSTGFSDVNRWQETGEFLLGNIEQSELLHRIRHDRKELASAHVPPWDLIGHYHTGGNPGRHEIDETQRAERLIAGSTTAWEAGHWAGGSAWCSTTTS